MTATEYKTAEPKTDLVARGGASHPPGHFLLIVVIAVAVGLAAVLFAGG